MLAVITWREKTQVRSQNPGGQADCEAAQRECFGAGEKPELCGVEIGRMGLCGAQGSTKTWSPLILFI